MYKKVNDIWNLPIEYLNSCVSSDTSVHSKVKHLLIIEKNNLKMSLNLHKHAR